MNFFRNKKSQFYFGSVMSCAMLLVSCGKEEIVMNNSDNGNSKTINSTDKAFDGTLSNKNYTDEEIFRGVIFFDGKFAAQIPSYSKILSSTSNIPVKVEIERSKMIQEVMVEIKKMDASYLKSFGDVLRGKDLVAIHDKLGQATSIVNEAGLNTPHYRHAFLFANESLKGFDFKKYDLSKEDQVIEMQKNFRDEVMVKVDDFKEQRLATCVALALAAVVAAVVWEVAAVVNVAVLLTVAAKTWAVWWAYKEQQGPIGTMPDFTQEKVVSDIRIALK